MTMNWCGFDWSLRKEQKLFKFVAICRQAEVVDWAEHRLRQHVLYKHCCVVLRLLPHQQLYMHSDGDHNNNQKKI